MGQLVEERVGRRVGGWRDDLPVAAVAAAAGALVWPAARVAGVDLAVRSGSGSTHVGVGSVVVTAVVVTLVAGALLRALARRTARGAAIWTAVAGSVWVASFAGPAGARSLAAGLVLASLHVVVGAVVVVGLRRRHAGGRPDGLA